jgi:hypothetical protein
MQGGGAAKITRGVADEQLRVLRPIVLGPRLGQGLSPLLIGNAKLRV